MTALDWIKFLPGWFAAAVAVWTLVDKVRTRRSKRALGPDDDVLRAHLATIRRLFKDIRQEDRHQDWFTAEERRDVAETLMDLSSRREDRELIEHLHRVVMTWLAAKVHALPERGPRVRWLDSEPTPPTPEQRTQAEVEREQIRKQQEAAERGLEAVEEALKRLVRLERDHIGRA
jgi:uncharacterized membrane protein YccC